MKITIIGHNIDIKNLEDFDYTKGKDAFIFEINDSILAGQVDGDVIVNGVSYEWEVIPNIDHNEYMMKFYTAKYNALLMDTKYEVSIYQSDEFYEDMDEDESEYEDFPMYEACIEDKETQIDVADTTTGRWVKISDVIEEVECYVYELLEDL